MAFLVRPSKTYYVDRDGRRVPKGARGAKKVRERAAKWYGQGIPGMAPKKRVPLARDKEAAQRMLDNLVRRAERGDAGLPDAIASRTPLAVLLVQFEEDLSLGLARSRRRLRPPSPAQVALTVQRVRDAIEGCGFAHPADLGPGSPAKLARYLQSRAAAEKRAGGISQQTAAFILAAMRRFVRWLAGKGLPIRAEHFDAVPGFDPQHHRVHNRRDVSPAELAQVLDAARQSARVVRGLAGEDRYHLYLTAFATGYRAGELAALQPDGFELEGPAPVVALPARHTKNRKPARQPIPHGVAGQLRAYLAGKPPSRPVWPGPWACRPAAVLRVDLAAAGVAYRIDTPDGPRYADFHALRHSYVSALAAAGAGPKDLQELARHSDPRLTQEVYTHVRPEALAALVGRLPLLAGGGPPDASLAGLSRDQVEGIALAALAALDAILGPVPRAPVSHRVAPATDEYGDTERQIQEKRPMARPS